VRHVRLEMMTEEFRIIHSGRETWAKSGVSLVLRGLNWKLNLPQSILYKLTFQQAADRRRNCHCL